MIELSEENRALVEPLVGEHVLACWSKPDRLVAVGGKTINRLLDAARASSLSINGSVAHIVSIIESHKPDASFDDSAAGAIERKALLSNIIAEIRASSPAPPGEGVLDLQAFDKRALAECDRQGLTLEMERHLFVTGARWVAFAPPHPRGGTSRLFINPGEDPAKYDALVRAHGLVNDLLLAIEAGTISREAVLENFAVKGRGGTPYGEGAMALAVELEGDAENLTPGDPKRYPANKLLKAAAFLRALSAPPTLGGERNQGVSSGSAVASVGEGDAAKYPAGEVPRDQEWPHDNWNLDAGKFVGMLQAKAGWWWGMDYPLKYLNLRIDTRDGGFVLFDREQKSIPPSRVLKAIAAHEKLHATPQEQR